MKVAFLLTILLFMVSCVKSKKTSIALPKTKVETPRVNKYTLKKNGYKCDIFGETEHKTIFLELDKKEDGISVSLNDFIDVSRISIIGATFDNYKMMSFGLVENEDGFLTGTAFLSHSDLSSLGDNGKVTYVTRRLTLNADITSGTLERVVRDDNSLLTTEFTSLAQIENCEKFEAIWI